MTRLRSDTKASVELARDVVLGEPRVDIVSEHAGAMELIRNSLICETSLLTPDVAECQ